ncbi:ATP-binding cassette domain-containing protein [Paenibacillus yanchengensis]|uniref:ATP-binding cassette domain-containing protein n=1 Tax=Paenibacillus yanchengensis TaxID=2035833 RepID=A0ABW4YLU7_9BACL
MNPIIKLENIHKIYPAQKRMFFKSKQGTDNTAVSNMSFAISEGEMVAFLGPNGAGKTTTIKMMSGILVPTTGEINVLNMNPHKNRKAYAQHIGVVFGQRTQLWWDLPLHESFEFLSYIYKIPKKIYKKNLDYFIELLELDQFIYSRVRELSLGQRMRGDIAAALLHEPKLLFLDEPTIGLDVLAKKRIREFLIQINKEKKTTLILTTHDMDDVIHICNRIIIIDNGQKIYDGDIHRFLEENRTYRTLVVDLFEKSTVTHIQGAELIKETDYKLWFKFDPKYIKISDLIANISAIYKIKDLSIQDTTIDEIVRSIYEAPKSKMNSEEYCKQ